ncbi:cholesterol 7-desaturase nvd-like isoform X1 [Mytilus trossulus]|uniref:cholesterol 7-desaturase nvd-like isoform X1 n=1 Tax=Mytilus trossulus TaxID=6551 RepID=UPI003006F8C1
MALYAYWKKSVIGFLLCILTFAVTKCVSQKVLEVPLLEVGNLWYKSFSTSSIISFFSTFLDFYSIYTYICLTAVCVAMYYLYQLFCVPLNRIRILGDIGYVTEGKFSMKDMANIVQKSRMVGEVPPVYPNGWFGLTESFQLKKSETKNIQVLGLQLALFRDEFGEAHAVDTYCPHLGANFAAGGRVVGDCIECPFHGWQFRGSDGKCTKIPYSENIPEMAKVKSYITKEMNGWIYIWHHAEEGTEPYWMPPEIEEIQSGKWAYGGRSEHYVNAHIEEVPENGADVQHLYNVHTPFMTAGIDLRHMWSTVWSFASHVWSAKWEAQKAPNEHIGVLNLTHKLRMFGKTITPINLDVQANQIGPGIVYLEFSSFFGRGVYIQSVTPVEPLVQKVVHNVYIDRRLPTILSKFFMVSEAIQVERDIMIWNNKRYLNKPLFVKSAEDSLLSKHRRWYSQFYSEHSPRLKFQKDTLEW